jgi:L-ascorbate metabolism protein UlaG (beta-lactamase superfamily)
VADTDPVRRVTLLGHASVLVELDGATFLMAPVLGERK